MSSQNVSATGELVPFANYSARGEYEPYSGLVKTAFLGANPLKAAATIVCFSADPGKNSEVVAHAQRLAEQAGRQGLNQLSFLVVDNASVVDNPRARSRFARAYMVSNIEIDLASMRNHGLLVRYCTDSPAYLQKFDPNLTLENVETLAVLPGTLAPLQRIQEQGLQHKPHFGIFHTILPHLGRMRRSGTEIDTHIATEYERFIQGRQPSLPYHLINRSQPGFRQNGSYDYNLPDAWVALSNQPIDSLVQTEHAICHLDPYQDIPDATAFAVPDPSLYLVATNKKSKLLYREYAEFVNQLTRYPGRWSLRLHDRSGLAVLRAMSNTTDRTVYKRRALLNDPDHIVVELFGHSLEPDQVRAVADDFVVRDRRNEPITTAPAVGHPPLRQVPARRSMTPITPPIPRRHTGISLHRRPGPQGPTW